MGKGSESRRVFRHGVSRRVAASAPTCNAYVTTTPTKNTTIRTYVQGSRYRDEWRLYGGARSTHGEYATTAWQPPPKHQQGARAARTCHLASPFKSGGLMQPLIGVPTRPTVGTPCQERGEVERWPKMKMKAQ
eukprot:scaffold23011_cov126-Isochrysis_galbana.AAC.2